MSTQDRDGNWHAVAGTFDGQTVRLYVDGTEVGHGSPAPGAIAARVLPKCLCCELSKTQ